jgi:RNA polymerase sigma-70 factor (ECF subfamily)
MVPGPDLNPDVLREDAVALPEIAPEAELVERAKALPGAFAELYECYYGKILGYVYRRTLDAAMAEELTSNTFFKALRALRQYDHRGHFGAWLYRIATNEVRAHRRTASRRREAGVRWQEELGRVRFACRGPEGDEDAEEKMRAFARLHEALRRLPEVYQVVISLRYFEAMPYAQIAEVLGRRLGTVKSLIHRGLERLKRQYRREPQGEISPHE